MQLDGLLLVDKPAGCTSHDVVVQARRALRQKKIGHCGTLDPEATGLLLLTVGRATRLTRFLIRAPKVYEGKARFGMVTDTYDLAGEVVEEKSTDGLTEEAVLEAMEGFVGTYMQTPPPYCAKKIQGVKYYELARRGEKVPDTKKEVTVYELSALGGLSPDEDFSFRLGCSSGTYARSIVHELGEKLGCGGTLSGLRRTRVGGFRLEDAITLDDLRARIEEAEPESETVEAAVEEGGKRRRRPPADPTLAGVSWVPFDEIQLPFQEIVADAQQERRLRNGQSVLVRDLEGGEGDWIKILSNRRHLIAVAFVSEKVGAGNVGVVQPKVVFS